MYKSLCISIALCTALFSAGCQKDPAAEGQRSSGVTVRFTTSPSAAGSSAAAEPALRDLTGYLFSSETLSEIFSDLTLSDDGSCTLPPHHAGDIYFVANAASIENLDAVKPGMPLAEFLRITASDKALATEGAPAMTGELPSEGSSAVELRRSVARIDLVIAEGDAAVEEVKITSAADEGYLFPQSDFATPEGAARSERVVRYETPLAENREGLFYLCEQQTESFAEVTALIGGEKQYIRAALPARLERNMVYTLRLYGSGSKASLEIRTGDWDEGAVSDSELQRQGLVDVEASTLPEGVRVNDTRDSVFVTYRAADFTLAVLAEAGSQVVANASLPGVTVTVPGAETRALENIAQVRVTSLLRPAGTSREILPLDIRRDGMRTGSLMLIFEPNPARLEGRLEFDPATMTCDFGDYADGELGVLTLPEGCTASLAIPEGQDPWIKLAENEARTGRSYRILGGWKPNDPHADGREQTATLTLSGAGRDTEIYTIKRRNKALPVVRMNGVWWCKYNAVGDARDFDAQIGVKSADPATGKSVFEYLKSCSLEEYMRLWNASYQGGSGQALQAVHKDGRFIFEGYVSNTSSIPELDAAALAPSGYRLPTQEEWSRVFVAGMKTNQDGSYTVAQGDYTDVKVRTHKRNDLMIGGQRLPEIEHFEVYNETRSESLTFYGPGDQWDGSGINHTMILFAGAKTGWFVRDHALEKNPGSAVDTRVVRFVKTPVEYMYE